MRSERCTQCGRWITDPDTLFLKKYACNYFCSDGCQSAWKRDREYEAQRTRDRLDSNPVHKAAPAPVLPHAIVEIQGGFSWNADKKFSTVSVTYGWFENKGNKESGTIRIAARIGWSYGEIIGEHIIANRLSPGNTLNGGTCTIQLSHRITQDDSFYLKLEYLDNNIWESALIDGPSNNLSLARYWDKNQLKEATKPVAVQIEPPASKKTAAPQPVVTKDTPVDAAPKGSDTKVTITGASYSYSSGKCTLKASRVQNDANHGTGSLKIVFWFSTGGQYNGGTLNGYQMAESLIGNPLGQGLSKGFGYPDVNVTADLTGNPPKGSYQPVITVNEKCEDGIWYIVGWANFTNPQQWK